jgi:hypothetical protein
MGGKRQAEPTMMDLFARKQRKEAAIEADKTISSFFFENGIPFNAAASYKEMVDKIKALDSKAEYEPPGPWRRIGMGVQEQPGGDRGGGEEGLMNFLCFAKILRAVPWKFWCRSRII